MGNCVQWGLPCVRWKLREKSSEIVPSPTHPFSTLLNYLPPLIFSLFAHTIPLSKATKKTRVVLCKDTHFPSSQLFRSLLCLSLSLLNAKNWCVCLFRPNKKNAKNFNIRLEKLSLNFFIASFSRGKAFRPQHFMFQLSLASNKSKRSLWWWWGLRQSLFLRSLLSNGCGRNDEKRKLFVEALPLHK